MANTCNVTMHVTFHDESLKLRKEFVNALEREYSYDYFDICGGFESLNDPEEAWMEISLGSRWSINEEILQRLVNIYDVTVIGVGYDFAMAYADSFYISPEE